MRLSEKTKKRIKAVIAIPPLYLAGLLGGSDEQMKLVKEYKKLIKEMLLGKEMK